MTDDKSVGDGQISADRIAEIGSSARYHGFVRHVTFDRLEIAEICDLALEALSRRSQQEPDGWQLVPVEPTPEMVAAGYRANPEAINAGFADAYRAMIDAAPQSTEGK